MKGTSASFATILSFVACAAASGQVGYQPELSPYRDIVPSQEFSLLAGYFAAHTDPARVAPQSGLITSLRYQWRASGPAHLTAELARVNSQVLLINPAKIGAARDSITESRGLYSLDAGLAMSLTGARTWHQIAPEVKLGLGVVSDFQSAPDPGGYKFGTRFALTWGGGIRWIPKAHEGLQLRLDLNNRLYTIRYPEAYFTVPTGGTAVLSASQARSFWTNNPSFALGIAHLF